MTDSCLLKKGGYTQFMLSIIPLPVSISLPSKKK